MTVTWNSICDVAQFKLSEKSIEGNESILSTKPLVCETFASNSNLSELDEEKYNKSTQELDLSSEYPTDRGNFNEIISSDLKYSIMNYGPCRPIIDFPYSLDGSGTLRKFSAGYYNMTTKSELQIPRLWLCYSILLDHVYCETCWLFANRKQKGFKHNWILGINDWHHINDKINDYKKSQTYIYGSSIRVHRSNNEVINKHMKEQISKEVNFWKNVLARIIKIILYLTESNTALKGNEGSGENKSSSEGNFIKTVKMMSEFDSILYKLLNDESLKTKYLSWKIQNEIIDLLSNGLCNLLCKEIKASKLFSIIMDSILDITKRDQLSVVLRKSGVQKRISSVVPNAPFVHCCAHNLNLVITDAAKITQVANYFFATIQAIFNIFSSSVPRWAMLAFSKDFACKIQKKVLKKICPTQWEASKKLDEQSEAQSLQKKKMLLFQFMLILCVWENILRPLHGVSKILQQKNMDLQNARDRLKDVYNLISELRNNYDNIVSNDKSLCLKWGLPIKYTEPHTVLMKLNIRFKAMENVCITFDFINPNNLIKLEEDDIVKNSYDFVQTYRDDISSDFTSQIVSLKELIKDKNLNSIYEMATFILNNDIATSYSEILAACILFLILPVTVTTAERTF
ncbi:hypothetical protein AGLY_016718 [Aphis glycines]|uniref:Uncharacterized protein n=1 Tax=Aphis glycines TaxID=307491 RepID=A0A6G0SZ26_APHGL|nr:hypothetical protein AGLY_016718 [Aphis glycines]